MKLYRKRKVKLHSEGTGFLIGVFILFFFTDIYLYYALNSKIAFYIVLPITLILFGLVLNFFRSPLRRFPSDPEGKVIASADGTIVAIEQVYEPEYLQQDCIMVSIFMSIFNVHANWYPVDGIVKYVRHHEGRFMAAYLPKSSVENERSTVVIRTMDKHDILVRQVAGAVAKRIVTYPKEGEECYIDDHMGFIKFGSRVDVYIPLGSEVLVKMDEKVTGNQTILAHLPQA
ncbi:phosphatidylserine decarboxylase family protein [Porphyromonas cangingivalis]|uniref:Phosphatidylserine decarboxylase proenzyme n=1 Tax=Porphyromonas cangingivalis TaxID=36874 RepID=A0A1T4KCK3_PORCN|nr:phosphatidylserine decarboxylase family protein [Porphyromonas cangingivalis]SJZ40116.1 phosphatidylserine decarboxylase [Porphyromonas cangingivalis]SPY34612.1 phosphatidylserine decarboxylase [Porphyromonas cangingivalis]VEJ02810.1 phosphatidylserine decarboxylase [Porphyromonas cangingivalis]